jgi:hypothetical protein
MRCIAAAFVVRFAHREGSLMPTAPQGAQARVDEGSRLMAVGHGDLMAAAPRMGFPFSGIDGTISFPGEESRSIGGAGA